MTDPKPVSLADLLARSALGRAGSAREMAHRLKVLDELHTAIPNDDSEEWICGDCGCDAPCPTRRILEGESLTRPLLATKEPNQ